AGGRQPAKEDFACLQNRSAKREISLCMKNFGLHFRDVGYGATTSEAWPRRPPRAPVSPRLSVNEFRARTPATPPTSVGRDTGSGSDLR
ncbi:unnamed protein product, partial [Ectocarpus sp. 4 AP-2014]